MIDNLFDQKLNYILTLGKGIKICLFDNISKKIYSNLIGYTKFLENNFFIFEMLENKERKIMDLNCIVFLNSQNLNLLLNELENPCYSQYIIIFNDNVTEIELEKMALHDNRGIVVGVYESKIGVIRHDNFLYTCDNPVNGIMSLIETLEIYPKICLQKGYKENIHSQIQNMMRNFKYKQIGELIFLDRNSDPFTPLIYNWKYLPMIKEYLNFKDVLKLKKIYTLDDLFYNENKFNDIYTVYNNLKEFRNKKTTNLFDIKEKNSILEKHLEITNQILKECIKNKEVSDFEMNILKSKSYGEMNKIFKFDKNQRLKCLLIYSMRNIYNYKEFLNKFPEYKNRIENYIYNLDPKNILIPKFKDDVDIKLGYEPPLIRVIEKFIRGIRDNFYEVNDHNYTNGPLIIYIEYITYLEYEYFLKISKKYNILIYIISKEIVTYKDLI